MGDAIFDTFYSSNVQFINNAAYQQLTVQNAGAALLDRIGKPVILVGHSQGGLMPIIIADARPNLQRLSSSWNLLDLLSRKPSSAPLPLVLGD